MSRSSDGSGPSRPLQFEDERDERAWVAFVAAFITKQGHTPGDNTMYHIDRLVEELRKRRKSPSGGPYRSTP